MKYFFKEDGFDPIDLVQFGIDHLASAKILFEKSSRCYDSAGYLTHLGIELLQKAIILHDLGKFPDEHNLVKLHSTVYMPSFYPIFSEQSQEHLKKISSYFHLRYPRKTNPVSIGSEDWKSIEQVYVEIHDKIPASIMSSYEEQTQGMKGGRFLMIKESD